MKMRITKAAVLSPCLWHSREVLRDDRQEERPRGPRWGRGARRGPSRDDPGKGEAAATKNSPPPSLPSSLPPSLSSVPSHRPLGGPPVAAYIGAARVAAGVARPFFQPWAALGKEADSPLRRCHGFGTLRRLPPGQEPVLQKLNSESSVSSSSSCCSDAVNVTDQEKTFHGLPDLIDKYWWIKSFFHSEPSPPPVGRKTLSASSYICISAVPTVEKDSVMDLLTEMLHTDLFFQEAWDLPNVWIQLQEENKSFRKVEKCAFKIFVSSLNDTA
ncbi:pancreatic progenitor cell differentiation and proliferation factor-like protein isoform X2 [Empidonax traillii]|uniref:pancreatic progenitor cell differentiation and proliferation factor-like protein isoform X2 n=1 Tax=Empidonax traillii TaxID=164674 RepID=UPI000FFD5EB7|nr:pancreatic progenitor cell differentiation and proliferation factor-like protein isoform X2 [Empidonax traillii]